VRKYLLLIVTLLIVGYSIVLAQSSEPRLYLPIVQYGELARGQTILVSRHTDGTQGGTASLLPSISADGRYVAFASGSSNLVNSDENGTEDIFVHDRLTGQTSLVSRHTNGAQGNGKSSEPSISADGRFIAFRSEASNLADGALNRQINIFVHDRQTGQTTLVSRHNNGTQGNGASLRPSISASGRFVAFDSASTNLVDGDTNERVDIFVHDLQTGQTSRVSRHTNGTQTNENSMFPSISADGRFVAFNSRASNLVDSDMNGVADIFIHDRQTGVTNLVSRHTNGRQGNADCIWASISADGRLIAFDSWSFTLVDGDTNMSSDVFVHDRQTGQTTRVSRHGYGTQGNGESKQPAISADGRFVTFRSVASNLVDSGTVNCPSEFCFDIFVHDRHTGWTTLVSRHTNGTPGDYQSWTSSISANGRFVAFDSFATNLVDNDSNRNYDVFVHDRGPIQ
jgi:Tol biopolymer transport system component